MLLLFLDLGKDHSAGAGLKDACYNAVGFLVDILTALLDKYHCAVLKAGNALTKLPALLDYLKAPFLSRKQYGLNCIGELIYAEHLDALHFSYATKVVIVG